MAHGQGQPYTPRTTTSRHIREALCLGNPALHCKLTHRFFVTHGATDLPAGDIPHGDRDVH